MKVHTLQIPEEGKRIEGEDPVSTLELPGDEFVQAVAPLGYALDVGLSEGGLFATGRLHTIFRMECVCCLSPFERPVEVEDFACQVDLNGKEEVDLTEFLREDILLALPAHPHCDEDGRRTCPGPPARQSDDQPSEPRRDVWGDLDRLNI